MGCSITSDGHFGTSEHSSVFTYGADTQWIGVTPCCTASAVLKPVAEGYKLLQWGDAADRAFHCRGDARFGRHHTNSSGLVIPESGTFLTLSGAHLRSEAPLTKNSSLSDFRILN